MLYENYRNKVLRVSAFLSKVVKHLALILSITGILLAIAVTMMLITGLPGKVSCPDTVIYGDAYNCKGNAFLSDVRLEYRLEDEDSWSESKPYLPGQYEVRAVGKSLLGRDRPGDASSFEIRPLSLRVWVEESSLLFGNNPTFVSEETRYEDKISCEGYVYGNLAAANTTVTPDVSKIRVVDKRGKDVTYAYDLQAVSSPLTFQKRPLHLVVESTSKVYDGVVLTYDHYRIADGYTLGLEDNLTAVFTGAQTDAGTSENTTEFAIHHVVDGMAIDVTKQYDLEVTPGSLTVEPRVLMITTGSLEAVYTGKPITCREYSLADPTALLPGHTLQATFEALASTMAPELSASNVTYDPAPIHCGTYYNSATFRVLDASGRDVTDNYNIIVTPGTIEVKPASLTVTTESASWVYDGQLHEHNVFTVTGLLSGHKVSNRPAPGAVASILNVGTTENSIHLTILDQQGNDVTHNYVFDNHFGTLTVTKRPITVTTYNESKVYDGTPLKTGTVVNYTVTNLVPTEQYAEEAYSQITSVGTKTNYLILWFYDGDRTAQGTRITTDNYDITYVYGTLEVTPRPLTVYTHDGAWIYDGQSHDMMGYDTENLVPGQYLSPYNWATITDVGTKTNSCDIEIYSYNTDPQFEDEAGNLANNYNITYVFGKLEVSPRPIIVQPQDTSKVYDGKPLYGGDPYVSLDSPFTLVEGHTIRATVSGNRTQVGKSPSRISKVQIFDGARDVTFNYEISTGEGTIQIFQASLVVRANSASKIYDGTPLTDPGYTVEVTAGKMSNNHHLYATVTGSITLPGFAPNQLTYRLLDAYGSDVSELYDITAIDGVLIVFEEDESDPMDILFGRIKDDQNGYIYLKMYSGGDYDGREWGGAPEYPKTLPGGLSYNYLSSIAVLNSGGYIHVAEFQDMLFYMLPYYMGLEGDYEIPTSDVSYLYSTSPNYSLSYYSLTSTHNGFDYLKGNLGEYARYEEEYREFVYDWYLTVDETTRRYMQGIIDAEGFDISDPTVILKIAEYIQMAATYSLDYDPALDMEENVAIAFLDQYKTGKCVHYASAATLLYRTLGIPARYTEGWMVATKKDTYVDIRNPGHAWVEVYIDGVGWIQVEVTGPDQGGNHGQGNDGPDTITITPTYTYKNYDGKYLYPEQKVDADSILSALLDMGYTYEVTISGRQLQPGRSNSVIEQFILYDPDGNNVTEQFEIIYEEGVLEVFDAGTILIRLYLYQLQKYYDGTPLTFEDSDYAAIDIPSGVSVHLSLNISLTDPGALTLAEINENLSQYVTYTIYRNGKDITSSCRLIFDTFESTDPSYVPIRVDRRPLEVTSISVSKEDDGKPLKNGAVFITYGSLISGHTLKATATGQLIGIGSAENTLSSDSVRIYDRRGNDVTDFYDIRIVPGTLTIIPPEE